jgi:hypothetical protein
MAAVELGRLGVWIGLPGSPEVTDDQLKEFAGQVEQAGYGAFWVGSAKADFAPADPILAGSTRLASGPTRWSPVTVGCRPTTPIE